MGWLSCFQPRKQTPPTIVRSAISHPLQVSKPSYYNRCPTSRTDEGLEKWKEASRRLLAEEQRAHELELSTYHQGRDQRKHVSGVELLPGRYDSSSQHQQRELASKSNRRRNSDVENYPPYYDDRRDLKDKSGVDQRKQVSGVELLPGQYDSSSHQQQREPTSKSNRSPKSGVENYSSNYDDHRRQNVMSSVDNYPAFEELMEHEQKAPRSIFERFDHNTDKPKRRPNSGVEHYAPMEAVDEHERPNPLALDSRYAMAFVQVGNQADSDSGRNLNLVRKPLEGQANFNVGRTLTHAHKPDTRRGRQADPWGRDGGLANTEISGPHTRQDDRPHRQDERPRQKDPAHKSSQQASSRERSNRRG